MAASADTVVLFRDRPTSADACFGTEPMNAVWHLAARSAVHRKWALSEIERLFMPPVAREQFQLYWTRDGQPAAVITWMFAPLAMIEQLVSDEIRLEAKHWTERKFWGDYQTLHLLFVDLIAPYGHCRMVVNDMRARFAGHHGFAMRRNHGRRRLATFRGYDHDAVQAA